MEHKNQQQEVSIDTIVMPRETYGLFRTYEKIFCTLSRTCISMFCWEDERSPAEHRLVTLSNIAAYEELHSLIPPTQHPEEYVRQLQRMRELPRVYDTREQLMQVALMRLLQWKKHYRGKLSVSGKVIKAKFRADRMDYRQLEHFKESLFGR